VIRSVLARAFGVALISGLLLALPVRGGSPAPTIVPGGDTRSEGEGAGLVGAPILVLAGVVTLGVVVAGATLLYVRLRQGD
jgi:hypothetical protein